MAALADLVSLRTLDLSQCDLITDDGLEQLEGLEQLQEVSLAWCRLITDQGLDAFTFHPGRSINLRRLRLSRCPLEEVSYLGRLSALEELDISGCTDIGSSALGKTLKYLKKLEALDVSYCEGIL
jgi:Leucine-rich repeat (LRR) protein